MKGRSSLARSIASNWTGFAVQVAVTFALTPFVLERLGAEGYGIWSVAVGLSGYYGLLDFGIRAGLTQCIARHHAVGDQEKVSEAVSTGVAALAVLGAAAAVTTVLVSPRAAGWFGVPDDSAAAAGRAVLLLGLGASVQFVLFPFSAVLTALQRFDIANGIGIATRLATAAATWSVLSHDGGLVGLAAVTALGSLLDYSLRVVAAYRLMPVLQFAPGRASARVLRPLARYGVWNTVTAGGIRLIAYSDVLVVGACLGAAAAAPFALAANVVNYFGQMLVPVAQVFFPAFARLDAGGDLAGVRDLYISGSRLMLTLAAVSATAAAVWATDFFHLWIGPERTGVLTPTLFRVLVAAAVFTMWQRLGCQVLLGVGQVRQLAALTFTEAALNLGLSLSLVFVFGPVGVAVGTLAPAAAFALVVHPVVVNRQLAMPLGHYYTAVLPGPLAAAAVTASVLFLLRQTARPSHWGSFMAAGVFTAAVVAIVLVVAIPEARRRIGSLTASVADDVPASGSV